MKAQIVAYTPVGKFETDIEIWEQAQLDAARELLKNEKLNLMLISGNTETWLQKELIANSAISIVTIPNDA